MGVRFEDNSLKVIEALDDAVIAYLYEAGETLASQASDNTRVGKGDTKNAWTYTVDEEKGIATIGNPLENAIWEEFGTGEYALHGDGRKGGWHYKDDEGKWHHTFGKTPNRALHNAFISLKSAIVQMAEEVIGGRMK